MGVGVCVCVCVGVSGYVCINDWFVLASLPGALVRLFCLLSVQPLYASAGSVGRV